MRSAKFFFTAITFLFILFLIACSKNSPTKPFWSQAEQTTLHLLNDMTQTFTTGEAIENPISIQLLDGQEEPIADVFITFQVTGGDGELLLNDERSTIFSIGTDSAGMAEISWFPGNGIDNLLTVSVGQEDYIAESIIVGALVQENGDVVLLSFQWLETDEFQFPYVLSPYTIEYDGRVLESNRFLVFSDESPDDIKLDFAALAEDALHRFKTAFEIHDADLGIFNTGTEIMSYTCKNRYLDNPQQFATDNGFLIYGIDSPRWQSWPGWNRDVYTKALNHELTHVVQFRMGASYHLCESWFMEGIAEYMSGGLHTPITSTFSFNQWCSHPDYVTNPIDAKSLNDLSVPLSRASDYYPAFHLAVKYLLESDDISRSAVDVRDMFFEIAGTGDFVTAFENCFGISIEYLRDHYYELMTGFLNK